MRVVAALALAFTLFLLSACSDSDDPAGASTARGIDADVRATREAGATLSNLGIYDGPNMYDGGR